MIRVFFVVQSEEQAFAVDLGDTGGRSIPAVPLADDFHFSYGDHCVVPYGFLMSTVSSGWILSSRRSFLMALRTRNPIEQSSRLAIDSSASRVSSAMRTEIIGFDIECPFLSLNIPWMYYKVNQLPVNME